MKNAMYLLTFTGPGGSGLATLTFQDGMVFGFDEGAAKYDGTYEPSLIVGNVTVRVKVTMPANQLSVVTGSALPFDWILEVTGQLPVNLIEGTMVAETNAGPTVHVAFRRMRDLPDILQAA